MKRRTKIIVITISFLAFNTILVVGRTIKLLERIEFSPNSKLILNPISFCVISDELFLITDYTDYNAGYVKTYKKENGTLQFLNNIGKNGYGPGDFRKPTYCCYNKNEKKLGVMDFGKNKIIIYKKKDGIKFDYVQEIICEQRGTDIKLIGNNLYVSGYTKNSYGEHYDLYSIDLTNGQISYLLRSFYKYGLKSYKEYEDQYQMKMDIRVIGVKSWFDIHDGYAYFVWEGDLRIIKLNICSGEINSKTFGMKPLHYVKPYASEKMLEAIEEKFPNRYKNEKAKMSYVTDIFVYSKYVLVVYEGPVTNDNILNMWMQFYMLDGKFIKEEFIEGKPGPIMWFDKEKEILYSLSKDKEKYFILKYKISSE